MNKRNSEERAIITFKGHFIAGLCATYPYSPIQNWDRLLEQSRNHAQPPVPVKIEPKTVGLCQTKWGIRFQPHPHVTTRNKNTSARQAIQQRHMGTARTRRLARQASDYTLPLINVLHPQDGIIKSLRHHGFPPGNTNLTKTIF